MQNTNTNNTNNTNNNNTNAKIKLPNGFGSITKKNDGNRRKPYMVRAWIDGKQKMLGSFATYDEAYNFLLAISENPNLITENKITFAVIYDRMKKERFPRLADATINNYEVAYSYCIKIHGKEFSTIKIGDLQNIINDLSDRGVGQASQKKVKQLLSHMWNHAIKYELCGIKEDISRHLLLDRHSTTAEKAPFTRAQIKKLETLVTSDSVMADIARCVLMLCYCGCRPSEFLAIDRKDLDLRAGIFLVRDSKTEAGRNRQVPIHRKMMEHYKHFINSHKPTGNTSTLIVDENGKAYTYHKFRKAFNSCMTEIGCVHTPHECRHTCATWLDNAGANDVATKKILGHACPGVTKGVYTHKTIRDLKVAINKIA